MTAPKKFICIHGHFYQPPRENPWLEEVEFQDSAYPFHDWNERVSSECYARNAASRILDAKQHITEIINNYSKISFNFGPTLLSWMELKDPDTYKAILEADAISLKRFSGHGSALAQVYNHMIMPLANSRDKRTQIIWGIRDFEWRFKRKPEGMWLAETAVDLESLDIMAECGIKFTILAPHQAKRVKKIGDHHRWRTVPDQKIDPKMPYVCRLPSGRSMNIFFYDGPVARAVAFEGLLNNGEDFASRLINAFDHQSDTAQLVHAATDGESYGHHHKFGDMALAYCLYYIEKNNLVNITNYGEYLEKFPPDQEVEIHENTSWSCAHGVERWRKDCGCNVSGQAGWTQEWRAPLREALDWLRDEIVPIYMQNMQDLHLSPWSLRDAYIDVILDRSVNNVDKFFLNSCQRELTETERIRILKLLEIQRNVLLMYTSCGWFFDDISGIEPVQILKYAARAIQLTRDITGQDFEGSFLKIMEKAKSNIAAYQNGAWIYGVLVKPAIVDLLKVGAHYAFMSLFEEFPEKTAMYCYTILRERSDLKVISRRIRLAIGHGTVQSNITWEKTPFSFAVLHLGDHNLIGGVEGMAQQEKFFPMYTQILQLFMESNIPEVLNLINSYFGSHHYSLWHLFKREQQEILKYVLQSATEEIESSFRQIYENYYPLMQIKDDTRLPLPKTLLAVVEFVLNRDLTQVIEKDDVDIERLHNLAAELKRWSFERDRANLSFIVSKKVNYLMGKLLDNVTDVLFLEKILTLLEELRQLGLTLDLWKAQNVYFYIGKSLYLQKKNEVHQDALSERWLTAFEKLGQILLVKID